MRPRLPTLAALLAAGCLTAPGGVATAAEPDAETPTDATRTETAGETEPSLLQRLSLDHRSDALPADHPVNGDLGRTGLDLSLRLAERVRFVPGLHFEYLKDHSSGLKHVRPTPSVFFELRF